METDEFDIMAELSYAFLHAVAARNRFSCQATNRLTDSAGVDATIRVDERMMDPNSLFSTVLLDVQLKSTAQAPTIRRSPASIGESLEYFALSLPIEQYNKYRRRTRSVPLLFIALFLPGDSDKWLELTEDGLRIGGIAYWVSLRGAPASKNAVEQTVYLPKNQPLTVAALAGIMDTISRYNDLGAAFPDYAEPIF